MSSFVRVGVARPGQPAVRLTLTASTRGLVVVLASQQTALSIDLTDEDRAALRMWLDESMPVETAPESRPLEIERCSAKTRMVRAGSGKADVTRSICSVTGKVMSGTRRQAEAAIDVTVSRSRTTMRTRLHAYLCTHCKAWHLGATSAKDVARR